MKIHRGNTVGFFTTVLGACPKNQPIQGITRVLHLTVAGKFADCQDLLHAIPQSPFSFAVCRSGLEPVHRRLAVFDGMRQRAQRSTASPDGLS